jgi:Putative zinc-binding metallo-peptidase
MEHIMPTAPPFKEASFSETPIRSLGLTIAGSQLEPILDAFRAELAQAGIQKVQPHFYLSTEWGVPFGTVSIAIPFYLARPELVTFHAERQGHVEGFDAVEILRYLRHEMGHVVNYAYQLYNQEEWVKHFGSITQSYRDDYRPVPFSPRFVQHLPGWYAQKHPDEDWAETFAVWLTRGLDWRAEYADRPEALRKLEFCNQTMTRVQDKDPLVTATEADEDVGQLGYSLEQYYKSTAPVLEGFTPGLDGALRAIFEERGHKDNHAGASRKPASLLISRLELELVADVYRWTGHFPERTRPLLRHLAKRADQLSLVYTEGRELAAIVGLTTMVAALAMNYVHKGTYLP